MRTALLALSLALTAAVVPASASPVDREGGRGLVQPGMLLTRGGSAHCTGGFLFDGAGRLKGRLFLSVAAHCYEDKIGEVVDDEKGKHVGKVVYSHWPYAGFADDIALVEVDRAVWKRTSPEVAGHPGTPTGVGNGETVSVGDQVGFSGWGMFTDRNSTTREQRAGVLNSYDDELWGAEGVVSPGDSGGPVVDVRSGAAVGSVSNLCVPAPFNTSDGFEPGCTGYGPTIAQLVRLATAQGFPVTLRTARMGAPRAG